MRPRAFVFATILHGLPKTASINLGRNEIFLLHGWSWGAGTPGPENRKLRIRRNTPAGLGFRKPLGFRRLRVAIVKR